MAVLHFHQGQIDHRSQAQRLGYRATRDSRNAPETFGLAIGAVIAGIGLVLLVGSLVAQLTQDALADVLLFFFSCPFLIFGAILLLISMVESTWRRLRRVQHHCGRCRFYRALDGQYAMGRCLADPREMVVRRTGACAFFTYSERAMVRDRFALRAEALARSPKHAIGQHDL